MSTVQRNKPIVTPHGALTPESCGTKMQPTPPTQQENELLCLEIALLHKRLRAQSHAIKQLNHTFRFVVTTLGQPMIVKPTNRPAKKMRKS